MTVKYNHYWRVCPDTLADYRKFIINAFIPGINKLGIHTVAAWSVLIGGYSEIIFEGVSNDLECVEQALNNPLYKDLNQRLLDYVRNYRTKVLIQKSGEDTYSTDFQDNTVKFIQTWDIQCTKRPAYDDFINSSYLPFLEEIGIYIAGEWEVLIGDGPRIILEGRSLNASALISSLQSKIFRSRKRHLVKYIENYESRLLVFHIQKNKGYKSASYYMAQ